MASPARTALVTGGNRGIGLEVCRQLARRGLRVILAARDPRNGEAAARQLKGEGLELQPELLDIADEQSVGRCVERLARGGIEVDVLINNAGILEYGALLELDTPTLQRSLNTHLLGPWWLAQALLPGMQARRYGRIVNLSSGWAAFAQGLGGPPAYSISKAALGALTVKLAQEAGAHVKVNAADPGWVRTRMGGSGAPRSVEDAAPGIVWLATLPDDGPSGGFFRDGKALAW